MPSYRTKEGKYVDLYKPVTSDMSNALADAVAKAMESGEPVTIGNGETHISTYVTPVHYQNNETMAAKVNLKCGDMVCDSIVLRKSIEGNLFVAYPSYEKSSLMNLETQFMQVIVTQQQRSSGQHCLITSLHSMMQQ